MDWKALLVSRYETSVLVYWTASGNHTSGGANSPLRMISQVLLSSCGFLSLIPRLLIVASVWLVPHYMTLYNVNVS